MNFRSYAEPLVTVFGGAGYIGAHLVRFLLKERYRVRVFDNFLFGHSGLEGLQSEGLEVIQGDIRDTQAVSDAVLGAEAVILLSALIGRRVTDVSETHMREVNFLASSVVLDAAIEHGATRFLFASTDSVYGIQSGVMYETGTPEPSSLYSRLKLRMEERVINSRSREFHPTALRIATCYGISPRMRFDLIVNALVRDAVCKKRLEIASGEQCRALVHVEDAARAFVSCLKAHVNLVSGEVFNLGSNDQKIQLHQLANLVATLVPDTEVRVGGADPDLFDYHLSASKIQKILDFNPKWGIPQAITELRDRLREGVFGDPYDPKYRNT